MRPSKLSPVSSLIPTVQRQSHVTEVAAFDDCGHIAGSSSHDDELEFGKAQLATTMQIIVATQWTKRVRIVSSAL
jgi:hypothetical protein